MPDTSNRIPTRITSYKDHESVTRFRTYDDVSFVVRPVASFYLQLQQQILDERAARLGVRLPQ